MRDFVTGPALGLCVLGYEFVSPKRRAVINFLYFSALGGSVNMNRRWLFLTDLYLLFEFLKKCRYWRIL